MCLYAVVCKLLLHVQGMSILPVAILFLLAWLLATASTIFSTVPSATSKSGW